jgi:uncharacterized protein GlcG (DUF336 family)
LGATVEVDVAAAAAALDTTKVRPTAPAAIAVAPAAAPEAPGKKVVLSSVVTAEGRRECLAKLSECTVAVTRVSMNKAPIYNIPRGRE